MSGHRQVLIESDVARAVDLVARLLAGIACEAVAERGQFTLALAGGTTPRRLYEHLASPAESEKVPWDRTMIFFGDERDVPPEHPDSNFGMVEDRLLGAVPVTSQNVFAMHADGPDLNTSADEYAQRIRQHVEPAAPGGLPAFDLVLLGMGGDGHTASLFPGSAAVEETERLVVAQHVPKLGRHRMTFTLPLINAARHVIMMVTGLDKAEPVGAVLGPDRQAARQLPAGRVDPEGKLYFVLDLEAAQFVRAKDVGG